MFGKIKDRLKNVFKASEDVIGLDDDSQNNEILEKKEKLKKEEEKSNEKIIDEEVENIKPKSKGFLGKIFSKKDEEELEEIEKVEEVMLEDVDETEKTALKEKKDLSQKTINKNKEKLEKQIINEDELEKESLSDETLGEDVEVDGDEEKSEGFFSKTISKLKAKKINENDFDKIWIELEIFLLEINIAFEIVLKIEDKLRIALIGNSFNRFNLSKKIREILEEEVEEVLSSKESNLLEKIKEVKKKDGLVKILILGVNGTGKTTTIAKIVNYLQKNNLSVVVAAADTFRAAATEQLEQHSKKLNFKLIMHKGGSDPAAVAFDSIEHAKAKNLDVVLIDTAGRMPNNSNLMAELGKIKRVSSSQISIFIGDSICGNDLIDQIKLFNLGVPLDGIILTKVDTDERPGSIVTTAYSIDKPIYFLGVGQNYEDLIKFDSKEVAKKLFELEEEE